jgi:hypothetical protein
MFKLFRHIIVFLISFAFLFATMGFNIYHHHCNKTGLSQYTYAETDISCSHQDDSEEAHSNTTVEKEHHDCCDSHHKEYTSPKKENCSLVGSDCCSTDLVLIKLDKLLQSYTPTTSTEEIATIIYCLRSFNIVELTDNNNNIIFTGSSPPPLLYGKELNIFFSRLKIAL